MKASSSIEINMIRSKFESGIFPRITNAGLFMLHGACVIFIFMGRRGEKSTTVFSVVSFCKYLFLLI